MHYPDSRWRPRCQGKSRDDVSGRILGTGVYPDLSVSVLKQSLQLAFWCC